jgi:hypothetical protein
MMNRKIRALMGAAAFALVAGVLPGAAVAQSSKPEPKDKPAQQARPRIRIPVKPKPSDPSNYDGHGDGHDLWAVEVVSTFQNFGEPNARVVIIGKVKNIGNQDFNGSRKVYMTFQKGGKLVYHTTKTITSLKKNAEWFLQVDEKPEMKGATVFLSIDPDPKDPNTLNDSWDPSKAPTPKQPG